MKFVILAALVVAVVADIEMKVDGGNYNFNYNTEDEGGHKREETAAADGSVSGKYSYVDPNGNLREVSYKAGPGIGFQPSGDISVDKKTAEEAAKLAELAPKAPAPLEVTGPINPFTLAAPFYVPAGIAHAPIAGPLHAPLPLAYNTHLGINAPLAYNAHLGINAPLAYNAHLGLNAPLAYNALAPGLIGRQLIW